MSGNKLKILFLVCITLTIPTLASASKKHDVILIIDNSGSMLKNDPERLRLDAVKLFIKLLGDDDYFGVIEFGDKANTLFHLNSTIAISKGDIDIELKKSADRIKHHGKKMQAMSLYTDYTYPLESAIKEFDINGRTDAGKWVILLSDGDLDPNRGNKRYWLKEYPEIYEKNKDKKVAVKEVALSYLENRILPYFSRSDTYIPIITIGLAMTDQFEILRNVSDITGGYHFWVTDAEQITDIYMDIFSDVGNRYQHSLGNILKVPGNVSELTIVFLNVDGRGIQIRKDSPDGPDVTDQFIRKETGQNGILKIDSPGAGTFYIYPQNLNGRFFFKIPYRPRLERLEPYYPFGSKIPLIAKFINDDNEVLSDVELLKQAVLNVTVEKPNKRKEELPLYDDGQHGDGEAGDGVFGNDEYNADMPGVHNFQVKGLIVYEGQMVEVPKDYAKTTVLGLKLSLEEEDRVKAKRNSKAYRIYVVDKEGKMVTDEQMLSGIRFYLFVSHGNETNRIDLYDDGNMQLHGDFKENDKYFGGMQLSPVATRCSINPHGGLSEDVIGI